MSDELEFHGTRKARETSSGAVDIRIPGDALAESDIEPETDVMVATLDGRVILLSEDDVRGLIE
ncbi:hypothetical protein [Halarchaeum grantii]|nr:hypothetical protein [Halarchaeum grantii]